MSEKVHEVPEPDLLPCPFCGGEAVERRLFGPDGRWWHQHQCSTCDVETPAYDSEVKAIAAWNRRTTPTAPTVDPAASIPGGVTAVADAAMPNWLKGLDGLDYWRMCRELWREAFAAGWAAHERSLAVELPPDTPEELRPGRTVI